MPLFLLRAISSHLAPALAATTTNVDTKESLCTTKEIDGFMEDGYLALPAILTQTEQDDLRTDVDRLEEDRIVHRAQKTEPPFIVEYDKLGKLCSMPKIVERVKELMAAYGSGETKFGMHHIHANRQDEGTGGVYWHQDYHCSAACHDREQLMVHVFFYFNGLNGTVGDLLALPGSQKSVLHAIPGILSPGGEPADLPGTVVFGEGNQLPAGSAVIVHSGLMHARRAKPGFESARYFVDISYCQPGPHRWPSYGNERHHQINLKALEHGHDRGGRYRHIFDDSIMYTDANADPDVLEAQHRQRAWNEQVKKMSTERQGDRQVKKMITER